MYDEAYDELIARTYDDVYAALRDPSGDVAFYRELAVASGGPVLELGCGTGRILAAVAAAEIACVGLDGSAAMLRVFREKGTAAELVQGDMRDFELGSRFALVTIPFRAFSHLLTVEDQLACLACVRRHLAPGGALAFDVFDPNLQMIAAGSLPEFLGVRFTYRGYAMQRFETIVYDLSRQVLRVVFRHEGGPPEVTGESVVELRWFYRFELEHLLVRAGFTELQFSGGFERRPWTAGNETVVVARVG